MAFSEHLQKRWLATGRSWVSAAGAEICGDSCLEELALTVFDREPRL